MEEAETSYDMFSEPKIMYVTMGLTLVSIVGVAVGARLVRLGDAKDVPSHALIEKCIGTEEGNAQDALANIITRDFAEKNDWLYDPKSKDFFFPVYLRDQGPSPVVIPSMRIPHESVYRAIDNYQCIVRRTQHRP